MAPVIGKYSQHPDSGESYTLVLPCLLLRPHNSCHRDSPTGFPFLSFFLLCPSRIAAEVGRRLDTISIHLYSLSPSCTRESNSCFPGFVQLGMHALPVPWSSAGALCPWPAANQDEKAGGLGLGCPRCRESHYSLMTHGSLLLSNWGAAEMLPRTLCCCRTCLAQPSPRHHCP